MIQLYTICKQFNNKNLCSYANNALLVVFKLQGAWMDPERAFMPVHRFALHLELD